MFQIKDNALGTIKYVGIAKAVVIDNDDPLKRGRIRVNSTVLGETNWIPYLTAPGTFNVPAVDDVVYIQCDGGFYTHPVAWGNFNYGDDDDLQFPEEFQRVSPTNKGFYTPGGHLIEIDDGTDELDTSKGIRVTTSGGTKVNISDNDLDSSVDILMTSGTEVKIDGTNDAITLTAAFGDTLSVSALDGIQASTPSGTSLSMKSGSVTIKGSGGELNLNGTVALGNDTAELLDLFDQTLDQLIDTETEIQTITVPTSVGPSGPPINSANFATILSNLTIIKGLLAGIKGSL